MDVGVVGASGYGGAELLRLLAGHAALKVTAVAAHEAAGKDLADVAPHLGMSGPLAPAEPDVVSDCALVFLATPAAASLRLAPQLLARDVAVVDLSGGFRLDAETFASWYGLHHTAPELTPAPYGLCELFRDEVAGARLVANPGCYPTAALLALAPLGGVVDPATVVVTGLSGTSGAGRKLREDLHASHALGNAAAYGAPGHRHTPEIETWWARAAGLDVVPTISFTPHLVPMSRGELCTITATLSDGADADAIRGRYHERYDPEPFVTVVPAGRWPATTHVAGANTAHVGVAVDERSRRVTVSCAIDNLVKGAAGQAIQNANRMVGLPETDGLPTMGMYP